MFDITKYCGVGVYRTFLNKPFNLNNRTIATNGFLLICTPLQEQYSELTTGNIKPEFIEKIVSEVNAAELHPALHVPLPEKHTCEDCNGKGQITKTGCEECCGQGEVDAETNYNTYYGLDCKSCDGEGYIKKEGNDTCEDCFGSGEKYSLHATVKVLGRSFNPKFIELIYQNNPIVAISKDRKKLLFKFDDAIGVLCAMET